MTAHIVFWCAAGTALYTYIGYPLLLAAVSTLFRRPVKKAPFEPTVSVLVAAYNEQDVIESKILNALDLDYPEDKLEIIVASDGSTDATNKIVEALADGRRVRLLAYPRNRGKVAALNDSVTELRGSIIVFSDASSMLDRMAIRNLVENFADSRVGAASGVYRVRKKEGSDLGGQEDIYWKYETFLKVRESRIGSVLGAHGSLYAVRKELYPFPEPGTINDDYVIPVRVLQRGYRIAYETTAIACEEAKEMAGFSRRVRVMAGNFKQLRELRPLFRPPRPFPLLVFFSHKVGRLIVPAAMVCALVSCVLLREEPLYWWLLCCQLAFYLTALVGVFLPTGGGLLKVPYYFCMINAAAFCGVYYALAERRTLPWNRDSTV